MEIAVSCDIVRNNNPKSNRFGQYGIVLTTSTACAYINYQDGKTVYCAVKNFVLVKHFELREKIGGEAVFSRTYWGYLEFIDKYGRRRRLDRYQMWELAQKYIRRTAVVV